MMDATGATEPASRGREDVADWRPAGVAVRFTTRDG